MTIKPWQFKALNYALGAFKIIIALFVMVAGGATAFAPLDPTTFLFAHRTLLVLYALIFFSSGLTLFLGKVMRKKRWTSYGLQAVFYCFIFAAFLNGLTMGWAWSAWMGNMLAALIVAGLWLWWKFKDDYTTREQIYKDLIEEEPEIRP